MHRILTCAAMALLLAPGFTPEAAYAQRQPAVRTAPAPAPPPTRSAPVFRPTPERIAPIRPALTDSLETERRQAARQAQAEAASEAREVQRRTAAAVDAAYARDRLGRWHRRAEIIVASAQPGAVDAARALGLSVERAEPLAAAGLDLFTFTVPPEASTEAVFEALRAARPDDAVDLNFVYRFEAAGSADAAAGPPPAAAPAPPPGVRIGAVIDSAVPPDAQALAGVSLRTARFGQGPGQATDHALAVASILADAAGREGLILLAVDVSEGGALPGASAASIAQALDWAATQGAQVVNISLAGPPNAVLAAVVRAIAGRGVVIVAAAGNDGPRAPPPHPAALPEVVAVTAVDSRLRIWRRATQGPHVDFAALGVRVSAAGREWTGTSLAAPVVAGVLLRSRSTPEALALMARDLGAPGRDPVFGFGYVSAP